MFMCFHEHATNAIVQLSPQYSKNAYLCVQKKEMDYSHEAMKSFSLFRDN